MNENLKVRLDKYLWAIRIYKTRSQAGTAIDSGKVKMNGATLKASHIVKPNEVYSINTKEKKWSVRVNDLLEKRMKASEVAPFFTDITPADELERIKLKSATDYTMNNKYDDKAGRPTKKNRRLLDDFNNDD